MRKKILITGATDGIGKATALNLAKEEHSIIVHGRNSIKVLNTIEHITNQTGNTNIIPFVADFASLNEVKDAAGIITKKVKSLDILINNAAVICPKYEESKDGYEMTFQVNYLAPFLLTFSLLPLIKKGNSPQIINIASIAHASSLDFNNILNPDVYDAYTAYEISKLANILFTYKLADKLRNEQINVNTLHPGVISTKLLHVLWSGGASVESAVSVIKNVIEESEKNDITGNFFIGKSPVLSSEISYNENIQNRMWEYSLALLKAKGIVPNYF